MRIFVDGSFCERINKAGLGVYVDYGLTGHVEYCCFTTCSSSFEAELMAIESGLRHAYRMGLKEVEIFSDCETAVDRFYTGDFGKYKVFINELINNFDSVDVYFIERDYNLAHYASKDGLYKARRNSKRKRKNKVG